MRGALPAQLEGITITLGLADFLVESSRIEGIKLPVMDEHIETFESFLEHPRLTLGDLCRYVNKLQPAGKLRYRKGMNVRVGKHIAPPGGDQLRTDMDVLLAASEINLKHPFRIHQEFERLHPFTDGNGRAGRALWARQMLRFGYSPGIQLGFLHAYYYQSLMLYDKAFRGDTTVKEMSCLTS